MIVGSGTDKLAVSGKFIRIVRRFFFERLEIVLHWNAKHELGGLFQLLLYAFSRGISAEEASEEMKIEYPDMLVASADTLLARLKSVDRHAIERAFVNTVKRLMKKFAKISSIVAIDFHDIPYYGDHSDCNILGSKEQRGTNWCHQYATLEIIVGEHRLTLAVKKLSVGEHEKAAVIRELIATAKAYITISVIMLDRAFYAIECIRTLKQHKTKFIVPVPRNKSIKKIIKENDNDLPIILANKVGPDKNYESYNLCLIRGKARGKRIAPVYAFATNMVGVTPQQVACMYRKRWSIETGYKSKKKFRIRTSTTSNVVRMLYFYFECLLYNAWYETKSVAQITLDAFKQTMRCLIKTEINPIT